MDPEKPSVLSFLIWAAVVEGGLGLVAVVLGSFLDTHPFERLDWTDARAVGIGVAATLPMLALMWVLMRSGAAPFVRIRELLDRTILPLAAECSTGELLGISLLAGLGEEMLFRGVIQAYVGAEHGFAMGLVVASVLFGLAHFVTPTYLVLATAIGAYLGFVWKVSDNLLAPIVTHALYDFVALTVLVRSYRGRADAS